MELDIYVQPTPNPNALKFILNTPVKSEGKSTYFRPMECEHNPLALALFTIPGVTQIYFFQNVVTITKSNDEDWERVETEVMECLKEKVPHHDPNYNDPDPEAERRSKLSPTLQKIEDILDHTIRPGLRGDGGDLQVLSYEEADKVLVVKYEGACGTCPSSTAGTLQAIQGILQEQYDPEIQVFIGPS